MFPLIADKCSSFEDGKSILFNIKLVNKCELKTYNQF